MTTTHPTFAATENLPACPLPAIHLNGTGRTMLTEGYSNAHRALNAFCNALSKVEFNARDYYVLEPDAFDEARATRTKVFALCDEIGAYLDDHLAHVTK